MTLSKQQRLESWLDRLNSKPLSDHSFDDIANFLESTWGLTYVFNARSDQESIREWEDTPPSLQLAMCALDRMPFVRLDFLNAASGEGPDDAEYYARIQHEVELRVAELQRRENTSFILVWNVAGSDEAHCETSDDLEHADICDQLTGLFTYAVEVCLGCNQPRNVTDSVDSGFDVDSAYEEVDDEWDEGEFEVLE